MQSLETRHKHKYITSII